MDPTNTNEIALGPLARRCVQGLFTLTESRLELFGVELQEERSRLIQIFLLGLLAALFVLLAVVALTAGLVVWLWSWSLFAIIALVIGIHGSIALILVSLLVVRLNSGQGLSASVIQMRKDRACCESILA